MGSETTHRVRLVRCPKCRMLLPEPADVAVYKCGGCDAILQVKNRKNDPRSSSSVSHEMEPAQNESNNSSTSIQEAVHPSSGECSSSGDSAADKKISRSFQGGQLEGVNSSCEEQKNECCYNESQDDKIEQLQVSNQLSLTTRVDAEAEDECDDKESQEDITEQLQVSDQLCLTNGVDAKADDEYDHEESQDNSIEQLQLSNQLCLTNGIDSEVDVNNEGDLIIRSSNADNRGEKVDNNSTVSPSSPAVENNSSEIITSSPVEHRQQVHTSFAHRFDRMTSADTYETPVFSPTSELSSVLEYMPKSPTNRSPHAYDGSVSSYDGIEDQLFHHRVSPYKSPIQKDKFLAPNSSYELHHQPRNLSAVLSDERLYATNYRLERDEFRSQLTSSHQGSYYPVGYESGSTSTQLYDDFQPPSTDLEKIKLMRMVHELQEQLNKTSYANTARNQRIPTGVTGKQKYVPSYYSDEIPEEEISQDLSHHRYPVYSRSNWSNQYKASRIPFSGEGLNNRHHIESCSCRHCSPQDWQYSAPLPPPVPSRNNRGFSRLQHRDYSRYTSFISCPTSPQQIMDSKFHRWGREAYSDDQIRKDHHRRKTQHMKERSQQLKRHLRPTAGGAPFVTCYRCFTALQLPGDFLPFRKRSHQLRCGGCSKVLKFSLENKTHIAPYASDAVICPPGKVDGYRDSTNRRNSDSISLLDDYGLSYSRSISTDGEPLFLAPFRKTLGRTNGRETSYGYSDLIKERKEFTREQPRNEHKYQVERHEYPETSSNSSRVRKLSPGKEEPPPKSNSPLHRLMGYSSPSLVIRGYGASSSGSIPERHRHKEAWG